MLAGWRENGHGRNSFFDRVSDSGGVGSREWIPFTIAAGKFK
jgi:hypothetical protein